MKNQIQKEQRTFKKENQLSFELSSEGLQIVLRVQRDSTFQTFTVLISSLDACEGLSYFDNLADLESYLKNEENIIIDTQSMSIKIVTPLRASKSKKIQIARIYLAKKITSNVDELSELICRCRDEKPWSDKQTKSSIAILSHILKSLICETNTLETKNSTSHENLSQKIQKQEQTIKVQLSKRNAEMVQSFDSLRKQIDTKVKLVQSSLQRNCEKSFFNLLEANKKELKYNELTHLQAQIQNLQLGMVNIQSEWSQKIRQIIDVVAINCDKKTEEDKNNAMVEIKVMEEPLRKRSEIIQLSSDSQRQYREKKVIKEKISALDWVNQECNLDGNLVLDENMIHSTTSSDVFGTNLINFKNNSFRIHVEKMGKLIGIGIIDHTYIQEKRYVLRNAPNLIYYCNNRHFEKFCKNGRQGQGFKEGQTVQIIVNLKANNVKWKVRNRTICSLSTNVLSDSRIAWVPYLQMSEGSTILVKQ